MPFETGSVLRERYRLVELLGEGAHGLSYLAHHEFLNHPCVVKLLPYHVAESSDNAVQRLRGEASNGFRVNHTNVVRVLDCDVLDGLWYFVMEYVDGIDLASATQDRTTIDWRQAVQIAVDAAEGLDAIHRAGLVHRDIKPSNLILGTDGHVRVADLGVVRLAPQYQEDGGISDAYDMIGTLAYAAPEVMSPGQVVGPAADLYSLGATLFELVTGQLPYGQSVYRTLLSGGRSELTWPDDSAHDAPEWFRGAILRLLHKDPASRFASPRDLIDFLEHPTRRNGRPTSPARSRFPEPRGLVVLPFENNSGVAADDWLGHALADHLARSLSQHAGAYVAEVNQFLQTMERVKTRLTGTRDEHLVEAGRLSGAGSIIDGEFRRTGETLALTVRIHQGHTRPVQVEVLSGALPTLADLEAELLSRLTRRLGLTEDADMPPTASGGGNPMAQERFFTGKQAFLRGDYETAMRLGREAIELDGDFGEAVGFVGVCHARMGQYDKAAEYNKRQQDLAIQLGDDRLKVEAHANLGSMYYFRGDYEAANDCLGSAARLAEELGLTAEQALIRNNLGFVLLQLGRTSEAEDTYQRAIDTHKKHGALISLIGPYNGMGHVLRDQKRYEEARSYFRRALALAQESDDRVNMGVAYMNLGHSALLQGRLADAKHELAIALNILEHTSFWNGLVRVYEYMADLNLKLSNCAEAVRCAEQRLELARRHSNAPMESDAWRQKARALELAGRKSEAAACLAHAGEHETG
ncbi:MAG: tetratricopeptide repeat protein [Phycisphaerae bacterium]|nr:tetratricopeptide repeat protein [Phycisphaerae bacterium]